MDRKECQAGEIKVSESVIETIVKVVLDDIDGVEGMTPPKPSIKRIFLKKKGETSVKVVQRGGVIELSISIIVSLGCKIPIVAEEIQNRVKANVQNMTGITVSKVNVTVVELAAAQ